MKPQNILALSLGLLFLLPGCGGNILDWAGETFPQGEFNKDHEKTVKPFLKGVRLYDQFDTIAIFDALWLADTVRTAYAQVYSKMMGKDEEGYIDFLRRELSANTYFVSFYVLSLKSIPLTDSLPLWVAHLEIDGKKYVPVSNKIVELSGEYLGFFGKRINNHKESYEIRFDRKDAAGKDIFEGKHEMKLFFSSPRYYGVMTWNLDEDSAMTLPAFEVITEKQPVKKENTDGAGAEIKPVKVRRSFRKVQHDQAAVAVDDHKESDHLQKDVVEQKKSESVMPSSSEMVVTIPDAVENKRVEIQQEAALEGSMSSEDVEGSTAAGATGDGMFNFEIAPQNPGNEGDEIDSFPGATMGFEM